MQKSLPEQIIRAKELLATSLHASMATVNQDGSPHNTPFLFMHDDAFQYVYWGSHPESEHSKNVIRTGQLFIVLYDARERGGLYIRADEGHMLDGNELRQALDVHNRLRAKRDQDALPISCYRGKSPQRMWAATIRQLWVNGTLRDDNDLIMRDIRTEITASDLLGGLL